MKKPVQSPFAFERGLVLSFWLPLLAWLLLPFAELRRHELARLPGAVNVNAPRECQVSHMHPSPRRMDSEPYCVELQDPKRTTISMFSCSPQGLSERHWIGHFETEDTGMAADCGLHIAFFDGMVRDLAPYDTTKAYEHVECRHQVGKIFCALSGRPLRTYAAVPMTKRGEFAAQPSLIQFAQLEGVNIRGMSMVLFGGYFLGAIALLALLYAFRPHGPRGVRWLEQARWRAVAASGGVGGGLMGALLALRPPDFGGLDEPARSYIVILLTLTSSILTAATACYLDAMRQWLRTNKRRAMVWSLLLILVVLTALIPAQLRQIFRSASPSDHFASWPSFKQIFYSYFSLAVIAPFIFCYPSASTWAIDADSGSPFRIGSPTLRLFAVTVLMGLVAGALGIAIATIRAYPNAGQIVVGFYKPASLIGLLLSSAPALAALSFAVNIGDEYPRWIREIEARLSALERGSPSAAESLRICIRLLLFHEGEIKRNARYLGRAAMLLWPMRTAVNAADLRQMAMGEDLDKLAARIEHLFSALEQLLPSAQGMATPLLLVHRSTQQLVLGEIKLQIIPQLIGTSYSICRNGIRLHSREALCSDTQELVRRVIEMLGPSRDGTFAFASSLIHIDFQCDLSQTIVGRSYELPLALMLIGLALNIDAKLPGWTATGAIGPGYEVHRADWLGVKLRVLGAGRNVFITAASGLDELGDLPAERSSIWRFTEEMTSDIAHTTEQIRLHIRAGGFAVVGVTTLMQAKALLYGERLEG